MSNTNNNYVINLAKDGIWTGVPVIGIPGEAATLTLGTVTTGLPGTNVIIRNSGDNKDAIYNFTIPRGSIIDLRGLGDYVQWKSDVPGSVWQNLFSMSDVRSAALQLSPTTQVSDTFNDGFFVNNQSSLDIIDYPEDNGIMVFADREIYTLANVQDEAGFLINNGIAWNLMPFPSDAGLMYTNGTGVFSSVTLPTSSGMLTYDRDTNSLDAMEFVVEGLLRINGGEMDVIPLPVDDNQILVFDSKGGYSWMDAFGKIYLNSATVPRNLKDVKVYAPENPITSTTAKRYVLGSASATDISTVSTNTNIYLENNVLYGAAWNDYAEFRHGTDRFEPGRVVQENGDETISLCDKRLAPGCMIVSDTFGFAIGQTVVCKTPIAVSGRALAYPFEDRDSFSPGDAVCSGPGGTVSKMTREEIKEYPERIIGTVSSIPDKWGTWGATNVPINGRIWIKVK